jgi:uncharacterized protein YutE (UPF0331/DUF86 family)
MINGIILQKLQTLDQTLTELRSLGQINVAQLKNDWRIQRAVERDLQDMPLFRNYIGPHYEGMDVAVLVHIVNHKLTDFERFRAEVLAYVQR